MKLPSGYRKTYYEKKLTLSYSEETRSKAKCLVDDDFEQPEDFERNASTNPFQQTANFVQILKWLNQQRDCAPSIEKGLPMFKFL